MKNTKLLFSLRTIEGEYRSEVTVEEGELSPLVFAEVKVSVLRFLGKCDSSD